MYRNINNMYYFNRPNQGHCRNYGLNFSRAYPRVVVYGQQNFDNSGEGNQGFFKKYGKTLGLGALGAAGAYFLGPSLGESLGNLAVDHQLVPTISGGTMIYPVESTRTIPDTENPLPGLKKLDLEYEPDDDENVLVELPQVTYAEVPINDPGKVLSKVQFDTAYTPVEDELPKEILPLYHRTLGKYYSGGKILEGKPTGDTLNMMKHLAANHLDRQALNYVPVNHIVPESEYVKLREKMLEDLLNYRKLLLSQQAPDNEN